MKKLSNLFFFITCIVQSLQIQTISFEQLLQNSEKFNNNICSFPTQANRIKVIALADTDKRKIEDQANSVQVIADIKIKKLIQDFLEYKQKFGSKIEQALYKNMSPVDFLQRLIEKRPLVFYTENDIYRLREKNVRGKGCFENIGTDCEREPLVLKNYLSYEEMEIAALLGVVVPTCFINNGNRHNKAILDLSGNFQKEGVYVGLVGARFEKEDLMEWKHMIITPEQNTAEHGYGLEKKEQTMWEDFYGEKFPTFQEATMLPEHYAKINADMYLNISVYKKRLAFVIKPFLQAANAYGQKCNKKAYCRVVGLGLGVWKITPIQEDLMLEVYEEIVSTEKYANISHIEFLYFKEKPFSFTKKDGISISFSKANPADKLLGQYKDNLLFAMYAWDGNAYPGNEYWDKNLTGSGDPAAACCSTIAELQNPLINTVVLDSCHNLFV